VFVVDVGFILFIFTGSWVPNIGLCPHWN
jgi:hypothetical protein